MPFGHATLPSALSPAHRNRHLASFNLAAQQQIPLVFISLPALCLAPSHYKWRRKKSRGHGSGRTGDVALL